MPGKVTVRDLGILKTEQQAYRRNGVKEYIVWQVLDQKISWFYLDKGEYLDLPVDTD